MSISTVFVVQRIGPTFGGMIYSGKKAASIVLEKMKENLMGCRPWFGEELSGPGE